MKPISIFQIWPVLIYCCVTALFTVANSGVAVADCRDDSRFVDDFVRSYRAAIRDVSKSCTGDTIAECEAAKQTAIDALSAIENANQTMLNNCEVQQSGVSPTNPGDIVINEIMVAPIGVTPLYGQWFEVFNPTNNYFELQGLTVRDTGTDSFTIDNSVIISPGGFVVLGIDDDLNTNGGVPVDYAYSGFTLNPYGDKIVISNGSVILDQVQYIPGPFPIKNGRSASLDPSASDALLNDIDSNWCATDDSAINQLPNGDFGTPGAINGNCGNGSGGGNIFFSEYIESSGTDKALEIYNSGESSYDLSNCEIRVYFNGNPSITTSPLSLDSVDLSPGDTFVLCSPSLNDSPFCDQELGGLTYNGNDALELACNQSDFAEKNTFDVIGQIGFDPGTEWGNGDVTTADHTLYRKCSVTSGDTNGLDVFDPSEEWDSFPINTLLGLGSHCP